MMNNNEASFASLGIILPRYASGNSIHIHCPRCDGINRKKSKSLSVDFERGLWKCWRCDWSGKLGGSSGVRPFYVSPEKQQKTCYRKLAAIKNVLAESNRSLTGPATRYLINRLGVLPDPMPFNILSHPNLSYWHNRREFGPYPALIGAVKNLDGEIVTSGYPLYPTYAQDVAPN